MYRSAALASATFRSKSLERTIRKELTKSYMCKQHGFRITSSHRYHTNQVKHHNGAGLFLQANKFRQQQKCFCSSNGDLPEHYKVALPALSPTMERGTLVRWTKEEGDQLNEGDLLAEIETDKATMGFETPEEGFLAKIILPKGSPDVPVGKLVCIIVTEKSDIAAFKDYVPESTDDSDTTATSAPVTDYPTHVTGTLPALSPTMEFGNILGWMKQVGDKLSEGDILAQIETDKATMDYETPEEGYLAKILIPEGTKNVPLGKLLCIIVENEEDIKEFENYVPPVEETKKAPVPPAPRKPKPPPPQSKPALAAPAPAPAPTVSAPVTATPTVSAPASSAGSTTGRVFATPYARKLAAEKAIDIALVAGSGPDGQIRAADVESYVPVAAAPVAVSGVAQPGVTPAQPVVRTDGLGYTDVSLTDLRKTNALRMVESKTTIPHYYLSVDICMDKVNKLKEELNVLLQKEEVELTDLEFVVKAASLACKKVPAANSSWQGDFIREFHSVDLSLVVDTEYGFLTPIVFNAQRKGLATISQEVSQLTQRAKEGSLTAPEFQGGTFTVANLGDSGIKNSATVIHPPQSCLLSIGKAQTRLIPDADLEKGYRTSEVMSVTLSCDHRVVDGAVGAQWLAEFRKLLEKPQTMLL